jgi:hypothetical protein
MPEVLRVVRDSTSRIALGAVMARMQADSS